MELTKEQKLYVINEMIRYYSGVKKTCRGMCGILEGIIEHDLKITIFWDDHPIEKYFPEFNTYKPKRSSIWWFPHGEKAPRLKYCLKIKKLIE